MGQMMLPERMTEIEENIKKHNMLLNGHMKGVITESCALGYYLRKARDSGLILQKGYSGIGEYAKAIAGISPSRATNLIKINKIISVGGYSEQVDEEYMEYSESQMQEISNLDDDDRAIIIPQMTVREIHAIKKIEMAETEQKKAEEGNNLPIMQMAASQDKKRVDLIEAPKDAGVSEDEIQERWKNVISQFFREKDSTLLSKVKTRMITYDDFLILIKNRTYFMAGQKDFIIFDEKKITHRSYCNGKKHFTEHSPEELFAIAREIVFEEPAGAEKPLATPQPGQITMQDTPEFTTATVAAVPGADTDITDDACRDGAQDVPYIPIPGQATVGEIPGAMPDAAGKTAAVETDTGTVGSSRKRGAGDDGGYTDDEMACIIGYFDSEYSRMEPLPDGSLKKMSYRAALECLRKCYGKAAARAEKNICRGCSI